MPDTGNQSEMSDRGQRVIVSDNGKQIVLTIYGMHSSSVLFKLEMLPMAAVFLAGELMGTFSALQSRQEAELKIKKTEREISERVTE